MPSIVSNGLLFIHNKERSNSCSLLRSNNGFKAFWKRHGFLQYVQGIVVSGFPIGYDGKQEGVVRLWFMEQVKCIWSYLCWDVWYRDWTGQNDQGFLWEEFVCWIRASSLDSDLGGQRNLTLVFWSLWGFLEMGSGTGKESEDKGGVQDKERQLLAGHVQENKTTVVGNHEKQEVALRQASSFVSFNLMISDCGLVDFPSRGNTLSWRGRRRGKIVRCRLDRTLATEGWHDLFPVSHVEYLPMIGSDHRPILATLDSKITKRRKQFRFDKRWIGMEGLLESIEMGRIWGVAEPELVGRIYNFRHEISVWRKENQPYGKQKIADLQQALEVVQNDDNSTPEELTDITNRLQEAYRDEEDYWKQKSQNLWLRDEDLNTKFFHASTKQRRAVNRIVGLHNEANVWVDGGKEVEKIVVSYFDKLFTSTTPGEFTEILENLSERVTPQENEVLTRQATETEVREALFMMHPEKASGPDGMTALFFERSWHIVKLYVLRMVNNFLQSGTFDDRLNLTHICLIPKTGRPTRMTELRPISLCNVGYKIIFKVLCHRLKVLLPRLISETQSAFVPGRLISDNILIAQEMFHGLRTNKSCKGKFMAVKTEMSKAYDRVE
ncbi:unnamed protein product [Microthlaspi erraticum]|uniref:Reverse transcriptase domain-containing protein n=1 Tax=Microthlaspi erraticum TaxID=1685480 RepID=A0A6D2JP79_9BRAS|nr:unnamed protein product [Microthlaspi erraticum]